MTTTTTQTHFDGSLEITVHDAKLTIAQHLSRQDPYCIVTLGSSGLKNLVEGERFGKEKFQTKVHNGAGQHPVWNESQSLSLKNMTWSSHLKVKVYDKDVGKDDFLGVCRINLDELIKFDNKGVQYFPLHKRSLAGKEKAETLGQIGVSVKFHCTQMPDMGTTDLKTSTMTGLIGATAVTGTGVTGPTASGPALATGVTQPFSHVAPVTTFNGSIDITISDAKILEVQHGSKQDPYCVVALGSGGLKTMMEGEHLLKEKFRTKVHNGGGQHPVWNETHNLSMKNMKLDSCLEVRVYDKDVIKDDYLAIARMTLGDLLAYNKKGVNYFPLLKKGAFGQTKSEEIGQVGVGVVFNCTEIPQAQADLKSQATDMMVRKDQQLQGIGGQYQTAQTVPSEPGYAGDTLHTTGTQYTTTTQPLHTTTAQPLHTTTAQPLHTTTAQPLHTTSGIVGQPQTVNQPLLTKPGYTQTTAQPTQGQVYGH